MRQLVRTSQFKRDFKKRILTSADEAALLEVLQRLLSGEPLEPRHRDHPLKKAGVACAIVTSNRICCYSMSWRTTKCDCAGLERTAIYLDEEHGPVRF
jgi:mRNA-degrading endonuclease YafQ of YafQ-DinJ toxin-antitoxin module